MVAKKKKNKELKGKELVKEVCRRIRVARSYWDAHNNAACRGEREKAMQRGLGGFPHKRHRAANAFAFSAVLRTVRGVSLALKAASQRWRGCAVQEAIALYNTLTKEQKEQIPQQLRVWLRYRSEKYFGEHRTPPKSKRKAN